jgi:hypothetical protein
MNISEQIERCSNLFNSIIIQAIMDAGMKPTKEEQKLEQNRLADVVSAMEYLFGRDSNIFDHHADLIGSDGKQIRELLLYRDLPIEMRNAHITPEKIRILRIRHRWHKKWRMKNV